MYPLNQSLEEDKVAESSEARNTLRMEYALLERALYASQSGILITDSQRDDNPIIWCNPGFLRLTGYQSGEVIGLNCRFLQGTDTDKNTIRLLREAVAEGNAISVEVLNYRKDGTPFWNDLNISPIYDSAGKLTHFIGIQQEITDRKNRSVEERRRALEYAEHVVSIVQEPILILDEELRVVTANLSFYRTFGVTYAETEGQPLYTLGDGQWNIPSLQRLLEEVLPRDRAIADFEVTHDFPRIGFRTMLLNARAIPPEGDFPSRIFLAIEDITHRPDMLDGSVDFARNVIDSLAAHISILDEEGTIVAVNEAWNNFARQNNASEVGRNTGVGTNYLNICGLASGTDAAPAQSMADGIRAVMRGDIPLFEYEYPCHAPSERRWFLARVTRLSYRGRFYTIVAHENITKRKLSEEAQQESEERYRLLTEGMPQFVWLVDARGQLIYANPFFFDYTGLSEETFAQEGIRAVVHPDDYALAEARFARARETKQSYLLEYRFFRASDSSYRWHQVRIAPVLDTAGNVRQWIGTAVEVDVQHRATVEREHHLTEIEALNIRLRRAIQETHHRVKNNLQVINALLEMQTINQEGMIPTREIHRIMRHIGALATIHDLLTHQLRNGDDISHISAAQVLERLLELLAPSIAPRRLKSNFEEVTLPMQKATSLAILVNELVSNAIKHSRGEIELTLRSEAGKGILEVCDDGNGFPEDFDPQRFANTGLELIESAARWDLRGRVVYDNHTQGGGRVVVTFPLES